jgi:hypothetical protein
VIDHDTARAWLVYVHCGTQDTMRSSERIGQRAGPALLESLNRHVGSSRVARL